MFPLLTLHTLSMLRQLSAKLWEVGARTSQPHLCGQEPYLTHCTTGINTVRSTMWTTNCSFDLYLDILIIFMEPLPLKCGLLLPPSLFQVIPTIISGIAHTIFAYTKLLKKQTSSPHFTWAILHFLCLIAVLTLITASSFILKNMQHCRKPIIPIIQILQWFY